MTEGTSQRDHKRKKSKSTMCNVSSTGLVFLLGMLMGWLGSMSFSMHQTISLTNQFVEKTMPDSISSASSADCGAANAWNRNQDGWHNVDVFYGTVGFDTSPISREKREQVWFSQARQDEAVYAFLRNKSDGFFVDLAANDAKTLSNTYILERDFGWTGLCIEPNPLYWYNLSRFRPRCQIVGAVVGSQRDQLVKFHYAGGDHGGIAGIGFDNGPKFQKQATQEHTVTLFEIFQRYHVPHNIDYLSLDVEGAEFFVMQTLPLKQYKIKILTIERPKDDLRNLLQAHDYVQIQRLSRWGETLWTHKSFQSELDLSRIDEFHGKRLYMAEKARRQVG